MDVDALIAGIQSGTVRLDSLAHRVGPVAKKLADVVAYDNEAISEHAENIRAGGPHKPSFVDVSDEDMLKFYRVQREVRFGHPFLMAEFHCLDCEARLRLVVFGEHEAALLPADVSRYFRGPVIADQVKGLRCLAEPLVAAQKLTSSIQVATGSLVFANFFRADALYGLPEDQKYSRPGINSVLGRDRLMQHLAALNVGYGQMGNMSISVLVKRDGTGVIIGPEYVYDDEEERKVKHEGYRRIGDIDLSVRRWMCADESVLRAHGEPIGEDALVAKVRPGRWEIEHFYDFQSERETIYSKLVWKG